MLETELRLADGVRRLQLPVTKDGNNWCTLGNIKAADVDLMQVLCCDEPVTLKPNGIFVPCRQCGHGYMLRDGKYDEEGRVIDTHMHLFHKYGPVAVKLVSMLGKQQNELDVSLALALGLGSGSSDTIWVKGDLQYGSITCCRTQFKVEGSKRDNTKRDDKKNKVSCPDCRAYGYRIEYARSKTIIRWSDLTQESQERLRQIEYKDAARA
jgi:hypothetical protein